MKKLIACFLSISLLFSGCGTPRLLEADASGNFESRSGSVLESEPESRTLSEPETQAELIEPAHDWIYLMDTDQKKYSLSSTVYWLSDTEVLYALKEPDITIRKYDLSINSEQIIFTHEKEPYDALWGLTYLKNTDDRLSFIINTEAKYTQYTLSKNDWSVIEELPLDIFVRELKNISQQGDFLKYSKDFHLFLGSIYNPNEQYEAWNKHANINFFYWEWSKDGEYFAALNKDALGWGEADYEDQITPKNNSFEQWDVFSRHGVYQYSVVLPYKGTAEVNFNIDNTLYFFDDSKAILFDTEGNQVSEIEFELDENGNRKISGTYDPCLQSKGTFRFGRTGISFCNFETGECNKVNIDVPPDLSYIIFNPSGTACFWSYLHARTSYCGISKVINRT